MKSLKNIRKNYSLNFGKKDRKRHNEKVLMVEDLQIGDINDFRYEGDFGI